MKHRFSLNFICDNLELKCLKTENNQILVESNAELNGGVKTDVLIPFDVDAAVDINTNNKDVALNYAIFYLSDLKK